MELLFESDRVVAIVTAGSSGRDLKPTTIKHVKQHVLEEFIKKGDTTQHTQSTGHLGVGGSMQDLHTYQISRLECRCL